MIRRILIVAALTVAATPSLALDASATSVTCAGAVTTGLGSKSQVKDLEPSDMPVLAYHAVPKDREFKQLARFGQVPVRMFVYRVNDKVLHLQLFEDAPGGTELLADMALSGDLPELTYRAPGSDDMVTVYCY